MAKIPQKVTKRISEGIKNFQPVLKAASSRDVNEADTSTIVTDMLSDLFGYDKYSEITQEFMIRSTYCDLAVVLGGKIKLLIEVKAIGLDLKDNHIKQAIDYATNEGVDWVILTNSIDWKIYKVVFSKPIDFEMVFEFTFLDLNWKRKRDLEMLYPLTREGVTKSTLEDYRDQKQALSRFTLGAIMLSDDHLNYLKKALRKLAPGIRIESAEIKEVLSQEVIKREVIESAHLKDAEKKVKKLEAKPKKRSKQKSTDSSPNQKVEYVLPKFSGNNIQE